MRIIFPTDENNGHISKRGAHFGKAKFYTIITLEDGKIADVDSVINSGHDSGACSNAIMNIMKLNPDALVVGGIGGSPAAGFAKAGLEVYVDKESATVKESIERFISGSLQTINGQGTCSVH